LFAQRIVFIEASTLARRTIVVVLSRSALGRPVRTNCARCSCARLPVGQTNYWRSRGKTASDLLKRRPAGADLKAKLPTPFSVRFGGGQ